MKLIHAYILREATHWEEMDSKKKEKDVIVYEKDMDMAGATRGVWLVKVPKYISSRWEKCPGNITAGQLNITK